MFYSCPTKDEQMFSRLQHREILQQLFVPGQLKEVDSDFICQAMCPQFSDQGSLRRQKETKIINFLQDFLQSLDDQVLECQNGSPSEDFESKKLSVQRFFQWVSGQAHVPIIDSQRETFKIIVNFEHDCTSRYGVHTICYPIVNACAVSITLPVQHLTSYSDFQEIITQAVWGGNEFTRH